MTRNLRWKCGPIPELEQPGRRRDSDTEQGHKMRGVVAQTAAGSHCCNYTLCVTPFVRLHNSPHLRHVRKDKRWKSRKEAIDV
jgi:hypothetical protein